jgi:hypothetical protein
VSGPDREWIAGRITDEQAASHRYDLQGDTRRAEQARRAVDELLDRYGWLFR